MELAPGYRRAEAGRFPKGWDAVKLGDFVSLRRGHDLTWRDRRRGDVPVMGSAGQNGFHDAALAKGPGVVLGRSGASFGQAHYCEKDFWPHNTALYVTDFRGNNPLFVFYFLKSIDFTRHNSGGAQQSLNRNFIYPIPVGVPRLPEQRTIAAALSDVDALMRGLEYLIDKRRDFKQAVMQQLLTGTRRLPGFHQKWKITKLGEIGSFSKGKGLSKDELSSNGVLAAIPYTAIYTDFDEVIDYSKIRQFTNSRGNTIVINCPCLLIASSSNMLENVGKASAFLGGSDVAVGGDIILYEMAADVRFLSYLLSTRRHRKQIVLLSQGSTIRHVYASTFGNYEIALPSFPEQNAIAAVLSDINAEIAALMKRRDKIRDLKQGMMQELLTGRTRLV